MKYWLIAFIFLLISDASQAQGLKRGFDAVRRGDFTTALEEWRPIAEQGDAKVQFNVGLLYTRGSKDFARDDTKAARWFKLAAEQGLPKAQTMLAAFYGQGRGVEQNDVEARKWFLKAAKQGDGNAQRGLSNMYFRGKGGPKDFEKAYEWSEKAAETLPPGRNKIAAMRNRELLAAKIKKITADFNQLNSGVDAARRNDFKTAVSLWRPLAESGHPKAQIKLGFAYYEGLGVEKDLSKALVWFRKAADRGVNQARFQLGSMYFYGEGIAQEYSEARQWFELAADQGDGLAQNFLGIIYANGYGVPKDLVEAYKWFTLAYASFPAGTKRNAVIKGGRAVAARMTPDQIAEAKRRRTEWANSFLKRGRRKASQ